MRTTALRVMTYNIHHGEGLDERVDIERIARVITAAKADIVALQEVDRRMNRSHRIDFMETLSNLTGMGYAFGGTVASQGGHYGNGVLTQFPVLEEKNLHYRMIYTREQRGLLQLLLDVEGREVVLMNTHLAPHREDVEQLKHAGELLSVAQQYAPRPVVVCGDFNASPMRPTTDLMKTDFLDVWDLVGVGNGATIPAAAPTRRIDYIFLSAHPHQDSAAGLKPISAHVIQSDASDHLPVVAEFQLRL